MGHGLKKRRKYYRLKKNRSSIDSKITVVKKKTLKYNWNKSDILISSNFPCISIFFLLVIISTTRKTYSVNFVKVAGLLNSTILYHLFALGPHSPNKIRNSLKNSALYAKYEFYRKYGFMGKIYKNGVNNFSIFYFIFDCKFIRILDCVTLTGKFVKTRQSLITF